MRRRWVWIPASVIAGVAVLLLLSAGAEAVSRPRISSNAMSMS